MSDLYGLKLEPMPNRLVNYGVTENGIAVIELTSDSAGKPLDGANDRSPNTYTHEMMRDIDEAIVRAGAEDADSPACRGCVRGHCGGGLQDGRGAPHREAGTRLAELDRRHRLPHIRRRARQLESGWAGQNLVATAGHRSR